MVVPELFEIYSDLNFMRFAGITGAGHSPGKSQGSSKVMTT